jgi:hypothetical protein
MSYSIGQVIFVLSNKTQTVLPGIIREEIHYRSLEGDHVSYKIAIGPPTKQRIIDLSSVDGEVYGSLDEIRNVLVGKLTAFVDDLCVTTNDRVSQWYGAANQPQTQGQPAGRVDPSDLLNEVQVSSQQHQPQQMFQVNNPRAALRTNLAEPDLNTREIIMDDGTIRKVQINVSPV